MLEEWIRNAVLGTIQGLTEFLPISSSGHLVLTRAAWEAWRGTRLDDALQLNVVLHAGTLGSVLVVYARQLVRLLGVDRHVIWLLLLATLPAVAIGLPLRKFGRELFDSPLLTGGMLLVTAAVLAWIGRHRPGPLDYTQLGARQAICIGLAQAAAVLPGLSRSGVTIAAGLAVGLKREAAATFAFLLAVPVIAGACVLELSDAAAVPALGPTLAGFAVAFVVGLGALWWLLRWLAQGRLHWFAYWCLFLGVAVLAMHWPDGPQPPP
jgi:undecaprenyl-diphosphatase